MSKFFIGVAWPYASGPSHLGNLVGAYLPADIFARFQRIKGNDVLMVSGSDMHGTPITVVADAEKISPEEVANRYHKVNSEAFTKFGISFDLFTTTETEIHKKVAQEMFLKLLDSGYLYKKETLSPFCTRCNRFLPDRYVEGECPHCHYHNARGDQCDECGRTLDPVELINAYCKLCKSTPEMRKSEHFFFKLSAFQHKVEAYVHAHPHLRQNVINYTLNWLRMGLKDSAITRDITWGIDIPLPGYEGKKMYVWFEAVIGYLSASIEWAKNRGEEEKWQEFWKDESVKHYYFLAKDNIPFHTIRWPAMLMAYGDLNLPYDVPANEFLRWGTEQFSRSRGIGISLPEYLGKYEPDPVRYYLTVHMPEHHDTDFIFDEFVSRNNSDLVGALGNFANRVLTFTFKNFGTVPRLYEGKMTEADHNALGMIEETYTKVTHALDTCKFKDGIEYFMALAHFANKYFYERAPWELYKTDRESCETVLHVCLRIVKALSVMMTPFMPFSAEKLWKMTGSKKPIDRVMWEEALMDLEVGAELPLPSLLFKKIEVGERVEEEKLDFGSVKEELYTMDLRIGEVLEVRNHPNADKLYLMSVNIGDEVREIVAGIKRYYKPEDLLGMKIVMICNLEVANIRGIESKGMLLAGEDVQGRLALLVPSKNVEAGVRLTPKSNFKTIHFAEFQKLDMRICTLHAVKDDIAVVNVGRIVKAECNADRVEGQRAALFFGTGKEAGIILTTEDRVLITLDRELADGTKVR